MNQSTKAIAMLLLILSTASALAQPVSDSDFIWIEPPVKQVAASTGARFNVAVMIDNATELGAIAVPLSYAGLDELNIDTTVTVPPDIQGVTYGPAGRDSAWTIRTTWVNNDAKAILVGFITFTKFETTSDTLCYLHFDVAGGVGLNDIPLDSTFIGVSSLGITDLRATDYIPTWTPGLIRLDAGIAGDMDCDGRVSVGDIIYLVNTLFKSGPAPCKPGLADIDCNDQLSLADVIWLVNYMFQGGPPPRPPCN